MKKIKAVIFDWAGTTVDYGCMAPVQAFVEVFKQYGIEPTMQEVREPMGMLKIDHIRTMLKMERISGLWKEKYGKEPGEEEAQALYKIFEEKLLSILHLYSDPKPGVVEVVNRLRRNGIRIGSTTGYNDKMMEIVVPAAKEKGYEPDVWFSPDSTGQKGRPWPYMIFRNMEALEIKKVRRVLKVGDTVSDIKEGRNAGVWSAGIVIGSSEMGLTEAEFEALSDEEKERKCREVAGRFLDAGADKVFYTIEDLEAFLLGWVQQDHRKKRPDHGENVKMGVISTDIIWKMQPGFVQNGINPGFFGLYIDLTYS